MLAGGSARAAGRGADTVAKHRVTVVLTTFEGSHFFFFFMGQGGPVMLNLDLPLQAVLYQRIILYITVVFMTKYISMCHRERSEY